MAGRSPQALFFGTRGDLEPRIQRIEAARPLQYVLCGMYPVDQSRTYGSLLLIDDFGVSGTGDAARSPRYLAIAAGERVHTEAVAQRRGGTQYSVTQLGNPKSIVIALGGLYREECLVAGSIGTVSGHGDATTLYREFVRELTRGFKKVRMYSVGPEALRLLEEGKRLVTMGVDEPPEYDLRRQ